MDIDKIKEITKNHNKWLYGNGGKRANFSKIELIEANFNEDDLEGADFSDTNLVGASFIRTNLTRANFSKANLVGTNLMGAKLWEANLKEAIYSVTNILKAFWDIPADAKYLILELMAHDAESCGIDAMNKWAANKETSCPFEYSFRDYHFLESKRLWNSASPKDKIPKLRGHKLLEALTKACEIKL